MRAGDDHDGGHPRNRELQVTTSEQPGAKCHNADGDGNDSQPEGRSVGERLRFGLGRLCLLHH